MNETNFELPPQWNNCRDIDQKIEVPLSEDNDIDDQFPDDEGSEPVGSKDST